MIDSGALLNLMMRKIFIEMDLNLADLIPVHDTFYGDHPRAIVHPHQTHRPVGVLWDRRKQVHGNANI
jgi:hypothetical protein